MSELIQGGFPLHELAKLDPHELQPGVMIGNRFCVLSGGQHSTGHWSVRAADTQGEFGREPTHRVEIVCVQPNAGLARITRGLASDEQLQRSPLHTVDFEEMRLYVLEAESPDPIPPRIRGSAFLHLVETLARLLARLHAARVDGIRFSRSSLHVSGARFSVRGLQHLLVRADASRDKEAMLEFLGEVDGDDQLPALIRGDDMSLDSIAVAAARKARGRYVASAAGLPNTPMFVGRGDVLDTLEHALADARVAHPRWIQVEGPAGIGKSTVVREFLSRNSDDTLALWGSARPGSDRDASALANALDHLSVRLAELPAAEASRLSDRLAVRAGPFGEILVRHAPRLSSVLGQTAELPEIEFEEQYARYLSVVASSLTGLGSQRRPLLLVLDNFELADDACRDVVNQIVRSSGHHHTLVVTCSRPTERSQPPIPAASSIELDRLSLDDVKELVQRTLPGDVEDLAGVAANLRAATEAWPLRLWTKLRDWVDDGVLSRLDGDGPWSLDPGRLREATHDVVSIYAHNFDRLTGPARSIATVAAARGGPFNAAWIADVTGEPRSVVERAFVELRSGALMIGRRNGALEFTHEQARQSLLSRVAPSELALAHSRLCGWANRAGDAASHAYHAEHAREDEDVDAELAALHLAAATACLERFDLGPAHYHFSRARARCGESRDLQLRSVEGLGDVAMLRNLADEAIGYYERVIRYAEPVHATRVGAKASYGLMTKGQAEPAVRLGTLALSRTNEPGARSGFVFRVLGLFRSLASTALPWGPKGDELKDALCHLYLALAGAATVMDGMLIITVGLRTSVVARGLETGRSAGARALQAAMMGAMGKYEKSRTGFDEAERIANSVGDTWALGWVNHFRAQMTDYPSGDLRGGLRRSEAAIHAMTRCGDLSLGPLVLGFRVLYLRNMEPLQRLTAWIDEGEGHAQRTAGHLGGPVLQALRILLEARRESRNLDRPSSEATLEQFIAAAPDADHVCAMILLAEAFLTAGEDTLAARAVSGAVAGREALGIMSPEVFDELWYVRGWSALRESKAGEPHSGKVRRYIRKLEKASKKSPRFAAFAMLLTARLAQANGDEARCRAAVARLVDTLSVHRQTYLVAKGHQLLARVLESRDVMAAAEHERRARDLLGPLGLRPELPGISAIPAALPASRSEERHQSRPEEVPVVEETLSTGEFGPEEESFDGTVLVRVLDEIEPTLRKAVAGLQFSMSTAGAQDIAVSVATADLGTIALNLLLAGRDALAPTSGLHLEIDAVTVHQGGAPARAGVRPGDYGVLELKVEGDIGPGDPIGGLSLCRQLTARNRGHLTVDGNGPIRIRVYLPLLRGTPTTDDIAEVREEEKVIVLHDDVRVRRTLVSALAQLGYVCETPDPTRFDAPAPGAGAMLVLGDGSLLASLAMELRGCNTVEIVKRGEEPYTELPQLRFPFLVDELQSVL